MDESASGSGPRPGAARPGRPDLGWIELIATVVLLVLFLTAAGIGWVLLNMSVGTAEPVIVWLLVAASVAAPLVAWSIRVRDPGAIGFRSTTARRLLTGFGAGALLGVLAVAGGAVAAAVTGVPAAGVQGWTNGLEVLGTGAALLLVLVAPFAGELLFRGILYGVLRRYGVPVALVISTLLWAATSVAGTSGAAMFVAGLAGLALGLLTGLLYERSSSLWPAVAAATAFGLVEMISGMLL